MKLRKWPPKWQSEWSWVSPKVGPLMTPGARLKVTVSGRASALWSPCSWHGNHSLKPWLAMKMWQGDHGRTILGWFGIHYPSITFLYVMSRKLLISQCETVSLDSLNNIDGWVFKKTQDNCVTLFYCMNSFVRVRIPSMNQQEIWQSLSNKIRWHYSRISINHVSTNWNLGMRFNNNTHPMYPWRPAHSAPWRGAPLVPHLHVSHGAGRGAPPVAMDRMGGNWDMISVSIILYKLE